MYTLPDYTEQETAWLAGLLEGEGCFTRDGDRVLVQIKMTDRDVIERVQTLFGGRKICELKPEQIGWKPQYRVRVQGKKAQEVMRRVYPYMGCRRREKIDSL